MKTYNNKQLMRRKNIIYKLRRKGIGVNTQQKTIFVAHNADPNLHIQIGRLRAEYHFEVQRTIT